MKSVRLDAELERRLEEAAQMTGQPVSQIIHDVVRQRCEQIAGENPSHRQRRWRSSSDRTAVYAVTEKDRAAWAEAITMIRIDSGSLIAILDQADDDHAACINSGGSYSTNAHHVACFYRGDLPSRGPRGLARPRAALGPCSSRRHALAPPR